jgi:carbonic anhydrase
MTFSYLKSQPAMHVDTYMKAVRVDGVNGDGDFGTLEIPGRGTFQAGKMMLFSPSLHTVDGKTYAAELQIVAKKSGPSPLDWVPQHGRRLNVGSGHTSHDTTAATEDNSMIAVVTLFFEHGTVDSPLFKALSFDDTVLPQEWEKKKVATGWNLDNKLSSLLGSDALGGDYWGYHGSLTVPPCYENVIYYVVQKAQTVGHAQLAALQQVLQYKLMGNTGLTRPIAGSLDGTAHTNMLEVKGDMTDSCPSLPENERKAETKCWKCHGMKSPVDLEANAQHTYPKPGDSLLKEPGLTVPILNYYPTRASTKPDEYGKTITTAAGYSFGHMELGGRFYTAKKMTVHTISSHLVNGKRYGGEIHIHHYLYGDWWDPAAAGHETFQVILVIPLEVDTNAYANVMEDFKTHDDRHTQYAAHQDLEPSLKGNFMQYKGTLLYPECDTTTTHYIVTDVTLKVSPDQLATEYPTRSGFDTNPTIVNPPGLKIYRNVIALSAMGSDKNCTSFTPTTWNYKDAYCWGEIIDKKTMQRAYPTCSDPGGDKQSPINIVPSSVVQSEAASDIFLNKARYHPVSDLRVKATSHSLEVEDKQNGNTHLGLGYVDINDKFFFIRSFDIRMPSEHTTDNQIHSAELQITHQRQDHWGKPAFNNTDFVVTSIFFDVYGDQESPLLKQLFLPEISKVPTLNSSWVHKVPLPLDLMRALGPILKGDYYRYDGSFTTPPCAETVKWFVFKQSLPMSQAQFDAFKKHFPNPAANRPVQALGDRKIAVNSFEVPGEVYVKPIHDFYLDRYHFRDRDKPSPFIIMGGICGAVVIAIVIMCSTFQRETGSRDKHAGGLTAESYGKLTDQRV